MKIVLFDVYVIHGISELGTFQNHAQIYRDWRFRTISSSLLACRSSARRRSSSSLMACSSRSRCCSASRSASSSCHRASASSRF
ncbi:hypothetical protein DPMN_015266 [Dreissena polymorpha]|uniref:Uncharacterized protein n=1 Tax=Dreissena polymorpha TaxID=45954 RepID=A0A9D4NDB6_DREPO|nr:hypothetical protein DPMN_015266 [Dreissena polymorpha]